MRGLVLLILGWSGLYAFPRNFEFGASTAALQIEGAWLAENKSLSVWDNLSHSGLVADSSTTETAGNSYYAYDEDIAIMKEYGIRNYRMSIAWTRIVPLGEKGSPVNLPAIEHYKKQFQALINAGITPFVTLYHNDMPAYLMIKGEGYTDPDFVEDFVYYADICFKYFGDLVKYWFTFNEPWCLAVLEEYDAKEGERKPYDVGHALLLAHAHTVKLYREEYQKSQKGKIGWVVNTEMYFPKDPNNPDHIAAAERGLLFQLDWFSEPLFTGDYPEPMKDVVRGRLKEFTNEEKAMLKGSLDFFALNHYFTVLTEPDKVDPGSYYDDRNIKTSLDPSRKRTDMDWPVVPEGLYQLIKHVHDKWLVNTDLELYITENGAAVHETTVASALDDTFRIDYLQSYLSSVEKAISEGVKLTKYFIWSLLDNFEWGSGTSKRFGVIRVEYGKQIKRIPKGSLRWYAELMKN